MQASVYAGVHVVTQRLHLPGGSLLLPGVQLALLIARGEGCCPTFVSLLIKAQSQMKKLSPCTSEETCTGGWSLTPPDTTGPAVWAPGTLNVLLMSRMG